MVARQLLRLALAGACVLGQPGLPGMDGLLCAQHLTGRPLLGAGTRVDVRSTARTGAGDLGRNASRIRRFLDELTE